MSDTPPSAGPRVEAFSRRYIVQTKGRWHGKPLEVEPWQSELLRDLFEIDPATGMRRWREALVGIARKNGKSTLCALIGLYLLLADDEHGAEVYNAAASRDQASVVFRQAVEFVHASPLLSDFCKVYRSHIAVPSTGGIYRVLAGETAANKLHGLNPSGVVIDELHAHRNPELYYALTTASGAREQPLIVSITTAGFDRETILWDVYQRAQDPKAKILLRWWQAAEGRTIDDRAGWLEANPSSWVTDEYLAEQHAKLPEAVFRRLHLNQWTSSEARFLPEGVWDACEDAALAEIEQGAEAWLGIDVGIRHDTTAVVVASPNEDGKIRLRCRVFFPPDDGAGVDLAAVEAHVRELCDEFEVREVAYDPWQFRRSAELLLADGVPMVEFPQQDTLMAPASQGLHDLAIDGRLVHDGDAILRQHIEAAEAKQTPRGAWRINKPKTKAGERVDESKKVDAAIACAIAVARAAQAEPGGYVWAFTDEDS